MATERIDRNVIPVVKQERAQATVALLLEATIEALEAQGESGVRLDDILDSTGVSRSSLYHHFGDRDGLIDAARAVAFSRMVADDIGVLERALEKSATAAEFRAAILKVTEASQSPARRPSRLGRAYTIGASKTRPSLAQALADTQRELTARFSAVIQRAQVRGWIRRDLDADAIAVFVQAFTHGRVISDIDAEPVDPKAWTSLVSTVIVEVFLVDEA